MLDRSFRTYRASLTVGSDTSTTKKRKKLFKGYTDPDEITKERRIGATLVVEDLRDWFQGLAEEVVGALNEFERLSAFFGAVLGIAASPRSAFLALGSLMVGCPYRWISERRWPICL